MDGPAPDGPVPAPARRPRRRWWHVPQPAALGAVVVAAPSLLPGLLPHAAAIQGVVTGLAAACGYALGLLIGVVIRAVIGRPGHGYGGPRSWAILAAVAGCVLVPALVLGKAWQDDVAAVMGAPQPADPSWWLVTVAVAAVVAGLLAAAGRAVARCARGAQARARRAGRSDPVAAGLGVLTGVVVTVAALGAVVVVGYGAITALFQHVNDATTPGVAQPTVATVSGSGSSVVRWEDLGSAGRDFIAGVPSRDEVAAFAAGQPHDPVRVYVGLDSSQDPAERARLAVADLRALGGFDRSVLLVATSTGTGQLDPQAIEPLELMYGGDTAVVATQYSVLPSWLSFLTDQGKARQAGTTLFDAVYAHWSTLPADHRPRLLVFGESLGAFGAEGAFADVAEMAARTDGVMLVGPPASSPVHAAATADRDAGSPQWQPVVGGGRTLRFGSVDTDLDRPAHAWDAPRLVYLQHASDPVVWLTPSLIWSRPDWLAEPLGPDVWPHLRWLPLVTFLSVLGDMMDSTSVPAGHGHVYGATQAGTWARIVPPPGWTADDTAKLVAALG